MSNTEQRTTQWFNDRKGRLTASIAGAVLGDSPWMTREDALQIVAHGKKTPENPAMQYGVEYEPHAAEALVKHWNRLWNGEQELEPCGFVTDPDRPWLGASPDGRLGYYNVEIKCPYGLRSDPEPEFKSIYDQPHYYAQVQVQMRCTGLFRTIFWQWSPFGYRLETVNWDQRWWDQALPQFEEFMRDVAMRKTEDLTEIWEEYEAALFDVERAKERLEESKAKMISHCNGNSRQIGPYKVTHVKSKGSISYAKLVKDHCPDVDVEPYRGKDKEFWKIS